jgi:purine nucleosidase
MWIHLDTDIGSDPDDACALALLLGLPDVEIAGITTTVDPRGRRAGYVDHCLRLAGRSDIPVAAGAAASLTTLETPGSIPDHEPYWPIPVPPRPSSPGDALDLLDGSIDQGARIVAIGPYTNLALLEVLRPGSLGTVPVVAMGSWIDAPGDGLPHWGPEADWNIQCDTTAAQIVAKSAQLTLVPLPTTLKAHLRAAHLVRLRAAGPLGKLLARQAEAHAAAFKMHELAREHSALPNDLLNFHYDPVTCAVATGWSGALVERMRLLPVLQGDVLRFERKKDGRATRVVVDIDAGGFSDFWLTAIETASRSG